jgi:predicted ester cyclase
MALLERYHEYIDCLNARDLDRLGEYVADDAIHNGRAIGLAGYRDMLSGNYADIPDLHFAIDIVVADETTVASRLRFDCRPARAFLGLAIDGRRVFFHENVFYRFIGGKISTVWSVIDPTEIAAQL